MLECENEYDCKFCDSDSVNMDVLFYLQVLYIDAERRVSCDGYIGQTKKSVMFIIPLLCLFS